MNIKDPIQDCPIEKRKGKYGDAIAALLRLPKGEWLPIEFEEGYSATIAANAICTMMRERGRPMQRRSSADGRTFYFRDRQ